ncbi:MAG TPA: peptidase [Bacteroidetes bacterium]|nr:PDZ domain-containing protein [Ignavibacteria bacterium]HCA42329.1 peptidase [Bacteroidota bacterium]HCN38187.1 peptidase [Bacteroidota bacterium]
MKQGYYRFPAVYKDKIVFTSDDDLWILDSGSDVARRITTNLFRVTSPVFSPDGKWIAFKAEADGNADVYLINADGGKAERLTYFEHNTVPVAWRGSEIIFSSNALSFHKGYRFLYSVDYKTKEIKNLPYGDSNKISFGKGFTIIGRNIDEPARWKRYKGGTAGDIWIDRKNNGNFVKYLDLNSNLASPMVIGNKIYFISDHTGVGNIFSADINGNNLKQHTFHNYFYARNASTDGNTIVYHCGGDLYSLDVKSDKSKKLNFVFNNTFSLTRDRFINPSDNLEDYDISKDSSRVAITSRGKVFVMGNWEGPAIQIPNVNGCRFKVARWVDKDSKIALMSDESGDYRLNVFDINNLDKPVKHNKIEIGLPFDMRISNSGKFAAVSNHRNEIFIVNLDSGEKIHIDRNNFGILKGFNWSPDDKFLAYAININHKQTVIKVFNVKEKKSYLISDPLLSDYSPSFDSSGKYLYLISNRILNPIYDNIHFDMGFSKATKPFCIVLQKNMSSPFDPAPKSFENLFNGGNASKDKDSKNKNETVIDFDGILNRMIPLPVEESLYAEIYSTKEKIFYSKSQPEGARYAADTPYPANKEILYYDLNEQTEKSLMKGVTSFRLSADSQALIIQCGNKIRILSTNTDFLEHLKANGTPSRKNGWVDLNRIKLKIDQTLEWQQMFREAWKLQKEFYWVENMSRMNWQKVLDEYYPLVERIATRLEFSDLMWEMQGELGTSHAYEMGGDYNPKPDYTIGKLGADYSFDKSSGYYKITKIYSSDSWDDMVVPPLTKPGAEIKTGDMIMEINGVKVSAENNPGKLLIGFAGKEVRIKVCDAKLKNVRYVNIKTIGNDAYLRYRDWVAKNKEYVHKKSKGKLGYIHIPNMMAFGFAEFHRHFLTESDYDGLVVDVRNNGGGHVSQLLLEKLARKRIGIGEARYFGVEPYPVDSVKGAMVMLTDEHAGSDGDIVSHCFKLMKLGKLVGKRTWGGVVGIWPRFALADGTLTSQPEFATWFTDVQYGVENYGTDPDIYIENTPADYEKEFDAQLDKAIEVALEEVKLNPPFNPDLKIKPVLGR